MRAVVVGASSGLGRSIAIGLGQRGASVALLARRKDRLMQAAAEAGSGAVPVPCDVTDERAGRQAIEEAADRLGGIDAVVYATGIGPLVRLADLDPTTWRAAFDTNVIGASTVTAAALPYLEASRGVAAYLTTVSASETPPWPGLGAYAVTKAALDKLVEAWRGEHPEVGFTRVVVGECSGGEGDSMTEFFAGWDPALAGELLPIWLERHYMTGALVDVAELVSIVDTVLRCGASASVPSVTITPRKIAPAGSVTPPPIRSGRSASRRSFAVPRTPGRARDLRRRSRRGAASGRSSVCFRFARAGASVGRDPTRLGVRGTQDHLAFFAEPDDAWPVA